MNRFIFILCVFIGSQLMAGDWVYISLGRSCHTGFCLRDLNIRTVAYPFDWLISRYNSLYSALEDGFSSFFTGLSLNFDKTAAVDYYGLEFRNVWRYEGRAYNRELDRINWEEQIPIVAESFKRKINRFKEVCNSDQNVIFIRWEDIDKERAKMLRDLIKSKYPQLTFVLVVIKQCEEFEQPWEEENIKNFSFRDNDLTAWKQAIEEAKRSISF